MRYVRKDRRIYDFSLCRLCGSGGGCTRPQCGRTTCMACGTPQCMSNGLGRGQCSVCLIGLLPGWSGTDRPCGYKGCTERAVCAAPRVKFCCRAHMARAKVEHRLAEAIERRDKEWEQVEDSL